jgi:glycosyltransferase involved in cell wall biosynthesis
MSNKISICICTLPQRLDYLNTLLWDLENQWHNLEDEYKDRVEILYLGDFKTLTVGAKRNRLAKCSTGDYIAYVDDDDTVSDTYLFDLLTAIDIQPDMDVYTFGVHISINGGMIKEVHYSKDFLKDQNLKDKYLRIPNHLMLFKSHIVTNNLYEDISFREDEKWAKKVLPQIKTEYNIGKFLYRYDCNHANSETLPNDIKESLLKSENDG